MRKYGLIGYPLGHSFSKLYFADKFSREIITDAVYNNYPLADISEFKDLVEKDPEICGLNITIPYKSQVIPFLSHIDDEAAEIGAVNVVKIDRHGGLLSLMGFNSDITGIRDTIEPFRNEIGGAIILGTGGSSKAVAYVLNKMGINIVCVSREKKDSSIQYPDLNEQHFRQNELVVNTSPLGMFPAVESYPDIPYKYLSAKNILFDLVYNPETTLFMQKGRDQGCRTFGGLKMLYSQAEKAWQIWNET